MNNKIVTMVIIGIIATAVVQAQTFLTNGLVAFYPFNSNLNDASGGGNNGINHNGAVFASGTNGTALSLNGTNYVEVSGNDTQLGMRQDTERTISAWVKLLANNADGNNTIISKYTHFQTSSANFYCSIMSSGAIRVSGIGTGYSDVGNVPIGEWHHLIFVLKAGNQSTRVYEDGKLVGSSTITYNSNFTTNALLIGANWDYYNPINPITNFFFNGMLDEIRIYNRALSDSEVKQLYAHETGTPYTFISRAVRLDHEFLRVGTNYQLQYSYDLNGWTNFGASFTATATTNSEYLDVGDWNQFFRLIQSP